MTIDEQINTLFEPVSNAIANVVFYSVSIGEGLDVKLILVWLVLASLFFTVYLGFINFRYFGHAIGLVFGKSDDKDDGQISRFQALATSLSGTVGLGNIAGVAVAISLGGPGAAFWMFVMGLIAMSTKFAEVTMGVKYRKHPDSRKQQRVSGGPMYYIEAAFTNINLPVLGKVLGIFFAASLFFGAIGAASLFQTNQVYSQILNITGGEESYFIDKGWAGGLFRIVIVGLVIIGGIKSIAAVTSKIVPFMGGLYMLSGLIVIGMNIQSLPAAFGTIFEGALSIEAGFGGLLGALLMGVQRAAFSNEAGFGTAAVAHSAAKTNEPVSQGFVGMLGPFIDTIIICMITALVIVVTNSYEASDGIEGVALTSRAFESSIEWFPYVLFAVVFLFAYSTIISWSYYGIKAFEFVFGTSTFSNVTAKMILLLAIIVGASASLDSVILLTDASVFLMTIPNVIGLYLLAPELKKDLKEYIGKLK